MINSKIDVISLNAEWQIVKVSGADQIAFLQGQITNDVTLLSDSHFIYAGHCDPKGKLISPLILFKYNDNIHYIVRRSVAEAQVTALKKYAVFSKVSIELVEDLSLFGGFLNNSAQLFPQNNETSILIGSELLLKMDESHYWIITPNNSPECSTNIEVIAENNEHWTRFLITQQFPIVDAALSQQYLPQAFNLESFDAINYKKGCYCGQEMVARAHYRGANKRALYTFTADFASIPPNVGDSIEESIGERWRESGEITAIVNSKSNGLLIQVILKIDLDDSTEFRLKESHLPLTRIV